MITKDINGNNLSANYGTTIAQSSRKFLAKIRMNGSDLSCGISKMTITKGSCGTPESFSIGNIISSTAKLELMEVTDSIKGETLEIQIGLYTGSGYEYITIGHFVASEVEKTAYKTSVVAYGYTNSKTNGSFTQPVTQSLGNIANAITTATGVQIVFDSTINTGRELNTPLPSGCSCYQALQIMTSVVGGYCVDTYDGKIAIKQYHDTSTVSVASDRMLSLPNIGETAFTVSGVKVLVKEATEEYDSQTEQTVTVPEVSYTYGTPVVLYDTNEYVTADLFNIYKLVVGYSYNYGTVGVSLGDPRIEGDDVLSVGDVSGNTYTVPCHQVTHVYDGGFSTTVVAVKPTSVAEGVSTGTPISQKIDTIEVATAQAQASASSAQASAESAEASAQRAYNLAESVNGIAVQAQTDAGIAKTMAQTASADAHTASVSAGQANVYANSALDQLGVVENIVGVLDMLQKNGDYQLSQDTSPSGKWYFTRSGTSPDFVYSVVNTPYPFDYILTQDSTVDISKTYYIYDDGEYVEVENPVDADLGTYYEYTDSPKLHGYYELVGIDEAIQNYVSSQLVVDDNGLWLKRPDSTGIQTKVLLSATDGVVLYGTDGTVVGKYGSTAQIGDSAGFHIEIDGTELGFYDGQNKVAYVRNDKLFIEQSVVVKQMDVGLPFGQINPSTGEVGLGQWSWKVHPNSENPKRNNLYLKWIG